MVNDKNGEYRYRPSLFLASLVPEPHGDIRVMQEFAAKQYRKKRVRLSGFLQPVGVARAYITLRIFTEETEIARVAEVNGTSSWKKYDVVIDVPDAASSIRIAVTQAGAGTLWTPNL